VGLPQFRVALSGAAAVMLAIEDLFPAFESLLWGVQDKCFPLHISTLPY
jgi:hypothetical protein